MLSEVSTDLDVSPALAGLFTTLPVLCFAAFGAATPGLARRLGTRRLVAAALAAVVVGTLIRAVSTSAALFALATVIALAGMAIGNVVIPALVKARFPHNIGAATAAYTTVLAVGTMAPAALTVPISDAAGSWRAGLAVWAGTALIALIPWTVLAWTERSAPAGPSHAKAHAGAGSLARSPIAWALALFFGLQSGQAYAAFGWLAQIYRDAGLPAAQAGLLLSVLPLAGVPVSLALPAIATRMADQRPAVLGCCLSYIAGYVGLLVAPTTMPLLWVVLIGLGGGAFPLALTMIGLRSRSAQVTTRLSGFTQSIGYLLSASGPLAIGALYGATGGWTVPIGLLIVLVLPQLAAGWYAGRRGHVDDQLEAHSEDRPGVSPERRRSVRPETS